VADCKRVKHYGRSITVSRPGKKPWCFTLIVPDLHTKSQGTSVQARATPNDVHEPDDRKEVAYPQTVRR